VVVWAHGTTGVADACAPSKDYAKWGDPELVSALLKEGFAVVAPDYEGLDAPGIMPYYNRSSHAQSVLQALKAAHAINGVMLAKPWAVMGHSQGGHVSLATAQYAADIGADYPLRAVVAFAPGSDLKKTSDAAFASIDKLLKADDVAQASLILGYLNFNGAFVALGLQASDPSIDPKSVFGDQFKPLIDIARDDPTCRAFAEALSENLINFIQAGGNRSAYPALKSNWYTNPKIQAVLNANKVGEVNLTMPVLVIQGTSDEQVPASVTAELVAGMRARGTIVTSVIVPDGSHNSVVDDKLPDAIAFVKPLLK
jgi:pimeloyl-ACP methyl ester carboxylesterase